jgi:CRP-like cAMP-binding protein
MEEIIAKFSIFFPLSDDLINYLLSVVEAFDLRKYDYLLKNGQTCNYMYYLQEGLLRCYYLDGEGKSTSSWFMREGNFVTAVNSYYTGQPTREPIHALEDCQLLGIHRDHLDYAYLNFMEFNLPGRKLTEMYYVLADERANLLRRLSATELYLHLKENEPWMLRRVEEQYIASYMGIDRSTLSRIKNNLISPS